MSLFERVELAPADPILGVGEVFFFCNSPVLHLLLPFMAGSR